MASTTFIDNQTVIYASWLNDVNDVVYNGLFKASVIYPSNIVCNGTVSGTGFTSLVSNVLGSPPAIGNVVPNTGAFTTLTLSNPLTAAYGGTGLTSPGTSGNVLTSNGTGWVSSAAIYFAVGQTWTDVTSSRVASTTYTNSTSKPITALITVYGGGATGTTYTAYLNGSVAAKSSGGAGFADYSMDCITLIIPIGGTYSIATTNGSLYQWMELR